MIEIKKIDKTIKNVKIIFRRDDFYINQIKRNIYNTIKYLEKFYKIKIPNITIELIYSRKEFEEKTCYKNSPEWLVAIAKKNKIFLISPLVIEKISCHKKSRIKKIIIHELCHIFNNKINKNITMWIDEGIAQFIAKQKKKKDFTKKDWDFFINNLLNKKTNLDIFSKNNGYKISYWLINEIAKKSGKNNLLKLIKINTKNDDYKTKIKKIINKIKTPSLKK